MHRMDKIKRSFLWLGNKEKGEKRFLFSQKGKILPEVDGRMGIKNRKNQSKALQVK